MSEVTRRELPLDAPSYRAKILLGEYDWNNPDANTQIVGFKALTHEDAVRIARHLAGARPILEVRTKDGDFSIVLDEAFAQAVTGRMSFEQAVGLDFATCERADVLPDFNLGFAEHEGRWHPMLGEVR